MELSLLFLVIDLITSINVFTVYCNLKLMKSIKILNFHQSEKRQNLIKPAVRSALSRDIAHYYNQDGVTNKLGNHLNSIDPHLNEFYHPRKLNN